MTDRLLKNLAFTPRHPEGHAIRIGTLPAHLYRNLRDVALGASKPRFLSLVRPRSRGPFR